MFMFVCRDEAEVVYAEALELEADKHSFMIGLLSFE